MIRRGAPAQCMRPMVVDDVFLSRLKLLIVMSKGYLKGYPLGSFRKSAVMDNAQYIFYSALYRAAEAGKEPAQMTTRPADFSDDQQDQLFLQRAQLLAVMIKSFVEERSTGDFRKQAMADNIDHICDYLSDNLHVADVQFLKVA